MNRMKTKRVMTNICFLPFCDIDLDLSEDKELKSEPFGVGFILVGQKLSVL